jgi:hypothetical protein
MHECNPDFSSLLLYFRLLVNSIFFLFDNIVIDSNSAMERRTRLATLVDQVSLFLPFLHSKFVIDLILCKCEGLWVLGISKHSVLVLRRLILRALVSLEFGS